MERSGVAIIMFMYVPIKFYLISLSELVSFLSAGSDTRESSEFQKYLTRITQEGHMELWECILGDFEKFTE